MNILTHEQVADYPWAFTPEAGYEYAEFRSGCDECQEEPQDGHFVCGYEQIPEGWEAGSSPNLLGAGWYILARRPTEKGGDLAI